VEGTLRMKLLIVEDEAKIADYLRKGSLKKAT